MSAVGYFCTTADIWSSKSRSFFGYTCHWIDANFERQSVALACKRFKGAHTYDRVRDFIYEINERFQLNHTNITAIVTDNGSNFVKAFKEFGCDNVQKCVPSEVDKHYDDNDDDDNDNDYELPEFDEDVQNAIRTLPKHQRCASHTLNLVATVDFIKILKANSSLYNTHLNVIKKCSSLWKYAGRPKSAEIIYETLGVKLSYPVVTRWNSMFDSISKIISVKDKLNDLCIKLKIPKFSQSDILYLEEYCLIMSPVSASLDFLQSEISMFYGYLIPSLVTLLTKLKAAYSSDKVNLLRGTAIEMEKCVLKRFEIYYCLKPEAEDAIIATVLCPSLKLRWLPALKEFTDYDASDIHNLLLKHAGNEDSTPVVKEKTRNKIEFFDFGDEDRSGLPGIANASSELEKQYYLYLADSDEEIEVLNKYTLLKKTFLRYNTTLPSSGSVERLFSFAGIVNAPKRHALSDSNFEKLVLMKSNSNIRKVVVEKTY